MKLSKVISLLNASKFNEELFNDNIDVTYGFSCDLMSDALMLLRNRIPTYEVNGMLITGLMSKQAIRTAEMLDLGVILFVRGKKPTQEIIELANDSNIIIVGTDLAMYTANGLLFLNGLNGIDNIFHDV